MNGYVRRILVISAFPVIIALFVSMFTEGPFTLAKYVDTLFYFALTIALIGLGMFVAKGGFFDFFTYSFKKVSKVLSKTPELHDETSFKTNFHLSERINGTYMKSFLSSGLFLTFLCVVVAYVI